MIKYRTLINDIIPTLVKYSHDKQVHSIHRSCVQTEERSGH